MGRTIPWLDRLSEIRRSVRNSLRSHYTRHDIERLFGIQRSAAKQIIRAVGAKLRIGKSLLITRADLEAFLDRVPESKDPASLLRRHPNSEPSISIRELIDKDQALVTVTTLPSNVQLEQNKITITFHGGEQLAVAMVALATLLHDPEEFAAFEERYAPFVPVPETEESRQARETMKMLEQELAVMERSAHRP